MAAFGIAGSGLGEEFSAILNLARRFRIGTADTGTQKKYLKFILMVLGIVLES